MQRVRMSLSYFTENGWDAEVVMVDERYSDMQWDNLLLQSVPSNIKIHKVKALAKKWTSRFGLGSIALRSLWFYRKKVNQLLKNRKYDLIYFSTTQFPVCTLGPYWKKRFGIPYVIDMQDPWHSEYYQNKPKDQRPKKYWFSYRLNKYLEPVALKNVDGLISVSADYITDLKKKYPQIVSIPAETITFGAFEPDMQIASDNAVNFQPILKPGFKNIVYTGRGGYDMHKAIGPLFEAFRDGLLTNKAVFEKLRFYFIGTSYAPVGQGMATITPLAEQCGVQEYVTEITDRISYYHTLTTLQQADGLFIPGSDDPKYTASKIYPYLLTGKPLLATFNRESPAINTLHEYGAAYVFDYEDAPKAKIIAFLTSIAEGKLTTATYNAGAIEKHSARQMTMEQCRLFDRVLEIKLTC